MEKLLHERLREKADCAGCTWPELFEVTGTDDALYSTFAKELADEIERYYIPRPRFEDGTPVQFGDEVEGCQGPVACIRAYSDGSGRIWGEDDDRNNSVFGSPFGGKPNEYVKRPTPKVYDADGVEIKEGVVGFYYDGTKLRVLRVEPEIGDYCVYVRDRVTCCEYYIKPEKFTLKEPDSLEKLRDDIKKQADRYEYSGFTQVWEWHDRLTALIERGA